MVALKTDQKEAENILKNYLKPLLLNQTLHGTSSILKVQKQPRTRWLFALFTIAAICNLTFSAVIGIGDDLSLKSLSVGIASIICRVVLTIQFLLIALESFYNSRFTAILKAILEVNSFIKCIGSNRKIIIFSWISSIFIFVDMCHSLFQGVYYFYNKNYWWHNNFITTMFSVVECEMVVCVLLILTITEQLEYLNRNLLKIIAIAKKKNTAADIGSIFNCFPKNITTLKIRQIYKNYDKIVDTVKRIQDVYAYQILGYIAMVFMSQIQRFEVFLLFQTSNKNVDSYDFVFHVHGVVKYFVPIVILCLFCEKFYVQVDKIKHSLMHVAIQNDDPETQRVCRLMLQIMRLQPPDLAVLGLFRVDLRLVLRYLAFLATYVVVVLQFSY